MTADSTGEHLRTLIVKGSGGAGLGDRLAGVVGAVAYALLTNRLLYVDWKDTAYGDGSDNYFPKLFSIVDLPHLTELPLGGTVHPSAWEGRLPLSLNQAVEADNFDWSRDAGRQRYSTDQRRLDFEENHIVMWELDLLDRICAPLRAKYPEFMQLSHEQIRNTLFRRHLKVREELLQRGIQYRDKYFSPTSMIGVHVRKTGECDSSRPNPEINQYLKATSRLLSQQATRVVFLATDNQEIITLFRSRFGGSRVLTLPKWMSSPGMPLHMNPDCPDPLQSAKDALVDAWLLGQCDHLITSKCSGFSWLARLFSNAPAARQIVLAPPIPWNWRLRSKLRQILPTGFVSLLRSRRI